MDYKKIILPAILLCTGNVIASNQFHDEQKFEDVKKLRFDIDEADLTITGTDVSEARISIHSEGTTCQTIFEKDGNTLQIINDKKRGGCACNYTISVPLETELNGKFGKSNISIVKLWASIDLKVGSGNIVLDETISPSVSINLGQGEIKYSPEKASFNQKLKVSAGQANLNCFLPQGTTTNKISNPSYMGRVHTNVPTSSKPDFDIVAKFGMGSLKVEHKKSNM